MPNWCNNYLNVSGPDIIKFREDVKEDKEELSFASLVPIPETYGLTREELGKILPVEQLDEYIFDKEGYFDWYNYCCEKWGTKWNATGVSTSHVDDMLCYTFETAWSPPDKWLKTVSKRYDCYFEMISYEEGCDFWGRIVIENGKILGNEQMTIKEKVMLDFENDFFFEEVKERFLEKLKELEYDKDVSVDEIDELRDIVDELDCEFGCYALYQIFEEFREDFYGVS